MVRLIRARRWPMLPVALLPVALVLVDVQTALADTPWPVEDGPFQRGPGGYLSIPRIVFCWLLFLLWVWTTDWVNQDVQQNRLSYAKWNSIVFFSFVAAFISMWVLPWFWLAAPLLIAAYAGPLTGYIRARNMVVTHERRVMTPEHLRYLASKYGAMVGLNISAERADPRNLGPAVTITPRGGKTERDDAANLLAARQSPGFPAARRLIADALDHRADAIMLDYTASGVTTQLQIDGVWHNHEPFERSVGDPILSVLKTVSALKPGERRAKQEGAFDAEFQKSTRKCKIVSQGTPKGERVLVQMPEAKAKKWTFEELGMRSKVIEQLAKLNNEPQGIIIYSAPPAGGLSTIMDAGMRALDRFMRDAVDVEDAGKRETEIENVAVTTFNRAGGETPMTVLPRLARAYPNIYVVRELADPETVNFLIEQCGQSRLSLGGIRAKEAAEALLRVLALKVPAKDFAPAVIGVVNERVIRKLCEKCKEAYTPGPELLKQLGLPADRVTTLYRPPTPNPEDKKPPPPCETCQGVGYLGRTGMFEVLTVNDGVRDALLNTPKLEAVRLAARKSGMLLLQQEGVALVAKGVTSVAELMRVLKG